MEDSESKAVYSTGKELGIREGRILESMEIEELVREIKGRTMFDRNWMAQDIFDEILEKIKNHL